jgi:hypothetical protein
MDGGGNGAKFTAHLSCTVHVVNKNNLNAGILDLVTKLSVERRKFIRNFKTDLRRENRNFEF